MSNERKINCSPTYSKSDLELVSDISFFNFETPFLPLSINCHKSVPYLDVPVPVPQRVEPQLVRDLRGVHRVGQILKWSLLVIKGEL